MGKPTIGTDGADVLRTTNGTTKLFGGPGDDIYIVTEPGAMIREQSDGGTDIVMAWVDFTLPDWVENLSLQGTAPLSGTGNDLDNVLLGNDADNVLLGLDGDDVLIGAGGSDLIDGGDGFDTAIFDGALRDFEIKLTTGGILLSTVSAAGLLTTDTVLASTELLSFSDTNILASDLLSGPVARKDQATVDEDGMEIIDVLANDTGAALSVLSASSAQSGQVSILPDGTIAYVPNPDAFGSDSFFYTVRDAAGATTTATVDVEIISVNDAPEVADDGGYVTPFGTPLEIWAKELLANDLDVDGDTLTVAEVSGASGGTVALAGDRITFTPEAGYSGPASFTYFVSDGQGGTTTGSVTLSIAANMAPVAADVSYDVDEDGTLSVLAAGILANDTDAEGHALKASLLNDVSNGSLVLNEDGSFSYTPDANFNGSDSFTYMASDSNGGTDTATVTIAVTPVNDAPEVADDAYDLKNTEAFQSSISLLANDFDVDGDALEIVSINGHSIELGTPTALASGAWLTLSPDGTFVYDPTSAFDDLSEGQQATDSFTYTVSDPQGGQTVATANFTITGTASEPGDAMQSSDTVQPPQEEGPVALQIIKVSSDANPGEAVNVYGHNFGNIDDLEFHIGVKGQGASYVAEILDFSINDDLVTIRLPENLPANQVYTVTAHKPGEASNSATINDAELWWAKNEITAEGKGYVYGKNLDLVKSEGLAFVDAQNVLHTVEITDINPHRIEYKLPKGIASGDYKIVFDNGYSAQTSKFKISVSPNLDEMFNTHILDVADFGALGDGIADDTQAIKDALDAAKWLTYDDPNAHVTVYFGQGQFLISEELVVKPRIKILGESPEATSIIANSNFVGTEMIDVRVDHNILQNITLNSAAAESSLTYLLRAGGPGEHLAINNVDLIAGNSRFDLTNQKNLTILDSKFEGNQISFGGDSRQVDIDSTEFVFHGGVSIIHAFGLQEFSITNSVARNAEGEWVSGRFIADQPFGQTSKNIYIADNQTIEMGASTVNANSGEILLFEPKILFSSDFEGHTIDQVTDKSVFLTRVASDDQHQWVFSSEWFEGAIGMNIFVKSGTGAGQTRSVVSVDATTGEFLIDEAWDVLPDENSGIEISPAVSNLAVYSNYFQGKQENANYDGNNAAVGLSFFSGALNASIDDNIFENLRIGTSITGRLSYSDVEISQNTYNSTQFAVNFSSDTVHSTEYSGVRIVGNEFLDTKYDIMVDQRSVVRDGEAFLNNIIFDKNAFEDGRMDGFVAPKSFQTDITVLPISNQFDAFEIETLLGEYGEIRLVYEGQINLENKIDGTFRADVIFGGGMADTINGNDGDDFIDGGNRNDIIFAGDGNDWIYGSDGADELHGDEGADHLWGGAHDDVLYGGNGNDVLNGGGQFNQLYGGAGADVFVFDNFDGKHDTIHDFSLAEGDRIDLRPLMAAQADDVGKMQEYISLEVGVENGKILFHEGGQMAGELLIVINSPLPFDVDLSDLLLLG